METAVNFFADNLEQFGDSVALIDESRRQTTYAQLARQADEFAAQLADRPGFILIEARNQLPTIVAYLGALRARHPVMLAPPDKSDVFARLVSTYRPAHVFSRTEAGGWELSKPALDGEPAAVHHDLALLLSTSGSTGSSKFVRLSRENIDANARSIAQYLGLSDADRGFTSLPVFYSYGHSILSSHLAVGASVVVTDHSLVDAEFWELFSTCGATGLAAVPYGFELLDKTGFGDRHLPSLRYVTQAGGRLPPDAVVRMAECSATAGWEFFVMYGQTEATARMAYLPPGQTLKHPDCIGIAIPGGCFSLRDEQGATVDAVDTPGELVYRGPNVMMGYASGAEDLGRADEVDELSTGDLACRNAAGLYRIVGRQSRFLKLFGLRINLDDVERMLLAGGLSGVCTGSDEQLVVAVPDAQAAARARVLLQDGTGLPAHAITVLPLPEPPLLPSGKYDYATLRQLGLQHLAADARDTGEGAVRRVYQRLFNLADVDDDDTFTSLGGDSMAFVQASVQLEDVLGALPRGWEQQSVGALEALPRQQGGRSFTLEAAIILRAVAITAIVVNHTLAPLQMLWFPLDGGACFLMLASGYSLARFQLSRVQPTALPTVILSGLPRIIIPTVLLLATMQTYFGQWNLPVLSLTSNLFDPSGENRFWFVESLVQIHLLVFALLSLPFVRRRLVRSPYPVALALLAVGIGVRLVGGSLWGTFHAFYSEPHNLLWMFILGMVMQLADTSGRRWMTTALALGLPLLDFGVANSNFVWLAGGGLLMLWVPDVRLPAPLGHAVATVASSSLYIYILHIPILWLLPREGYWPLLIALGLAVGIVGRAGTDWILSVAYRWRRAPS